MGAGGDRAASARRAELSLLAARATSVPYVVGDGSVESVGDCRDVDVHGVAKGWVIDQMVDAVLEIREVQSVVVDLGGDLRHASGAAGPPSFVTVAIENPFAVADNTAPLTTLRLSDRAVATSSGGRRGWWVEGRWYGHLLDPATGWPLRTAAPRLRRRRRTRTPESFPSRPGVARAHVSARRPTPPAPDRPPYDRCS